MVSVTAFSAPKPAPILAGSAVGQAPRRRGRSPVRTIPDIEPSAAWLDAITGFELNQLAANLSPRTITSRRSAVTVLARRLTAEGLDPGDVTRAVLQRYLLGEVQARQHSGATAIYASLKAFWTWWAAEYEAPSPLIGVPRPRGESAPVAVLSAGQIKAILKATSGKTWEATRNRAAVLLMLETGLRRSELLALEPADVDLKQRTVRVRKGKGGRPRTAVCGFESASAVHRWLRLRGDASGPLFLSRKGGGLGASGFGQMLDRIGRQAGIPNLHAHAFRHTWADAMLRAGARDLDIQTLAGWSSGRMLARYGSAMAAERAVAAARELPVARLVQGA